MYTTLNFYVVKVGVCIDALNIVFSATKIIICSYLDVLRG